MAFSTGKNNGLCAKTTLTNKPDQAKKQVFIPFSDELDEQAISVANVFIYENLLAG